MNRYRRILQSFSPEVLPVDNCYDICAGINTIINNNSNIEEILCYAPWCRADTYQQIGVLDAARRGVPVTILVRPPTGTLRGDAKLLLHESILNKNLQVLLYQAHRVYKVNIIDYIYTRSKEKDYPVDSISAQEN